MGVPKHGANSAHAKSCKKYKDGNRHVINRKRIADRIAAGKKVRRRQQKTRDMILNDWVKNTKVEKPYVTSSGQVMWGTSAEGAKKHGKEN